ncbi:AAA family ATPase [Methylomagnum ishizawai]|uniref:AAA family ATPase n=1 Tax=Methylomagnum ishizawai TaxID=1760988 RepID=UPI001C33FCB0|nr:MoxR family ATPase [Methylomagnum ishizawai]BBL76438.1 ATP-binding protein [Methylomagnum ishizawai]
MNPAIQLSPSEAFDFLLHVAVVRPVFMWGAPGIGKSALVQRFADTVGLECVSLLGSQLAPEDLLGVPKIDGECSRFFPPANIVRAQAFVLFLDELNASSHEIQKAFYSLILDRRVGEYHLPAGTIVIGAGNRAKDAAIVKPMPSALINRLAHIHLRADHRQWLDWAMAEGGIHAWVLDYLRLRPDHLWSEPPKHEEPFSTPRSWHMLSDALHSFGDGIADTLLEALAFGLLSPAHAGQFKGFVKQTRQKHTLHAILKGEAQWPAAPCDRDVLYFLAQSFRGLLRKELPEDEASVRGEHKQLAVKAKDRLRELARISVEIAQSVLAEDDEGQRLPAWFLVEVARDLPRLAARDKGQP